MLALNSTNQPTLNMTGSKVFEWGNTILKKINRNESDISLAKFMESLANAADYKFTERGNNFKWDADGSEGWYENEKILRLICSHLFNVLNERNKNSTITVEVFNDEDYTMMVARYNGAPLLRSEFDSIFRNMPASDAPFYKQELYFCWHTMRLLGGFITVPEDTNQGKYITVGFPKKNNHLFAA